MGSINNVKALVKFFVAIAVSFDKNIPKTYKRNNNIKGIRKALLFHNICFLSLKLITRKELATKTQIVIVFIDKNKGSVPTKR